jgi:hypothetical protein
VLKDLARWVRRSTKARIRRFAIGNNGPEKFLTHTGNQRFIALAVGDLDQAEAF